MLPQWLVRWALLVTVAAWTVGLVRLWHPPLLAALGFGIVGMTSTVKFILNYSLEADRNSYLWYNVRCLLFFLLLLADEFE